MWKKQLFYCVLVLGLLRLGWSLYSMIPSPFSQGKPHVQKYTVLPEQYEEEFKKVIEKDIDNIMDDVCVNSSELDRYIGLLLAKKEENYPGFGERNNTIIEALRKVMMNYVRMYNTLLNQKMSDVNPKATKREIQNCIRKAGHEEIKPLLDQLMYSKEGN